MNFWQIRYPLFDDTTDNGGGDPTYDPSADPTTDPTTDPNAADPNAYDPYANGDYNNPATGAYDPTLDPANYDENGKPYPGLVDNNGNVITDSNGNFIQNPSASTKQAANSPSKGSTPSPAAKSAAQKAAQAVGAVGAGVTSAAQQAAQNRLNTAKINIPGVSSYYSTLDQLANQEAKQRKGALQDIYMESKAQNPSVSPYNPVGAPKMSANYMSALSGLEQQGMNRLTTAPQYGTNMTPAPTLSQFQVPPPSTLENIANVAGPIASTGSTLANIFNPQPSSTPTFNQGTPTGGAPTAPTATPDNPNVMPTSAQPTVYNPNANANPAGFIIPGAPAPPVNQQDPEDLGQGYGG